MKFSDLREVHHTLRGYERLHAFPKGWPIWVEADGRCFALTFENRSGGYFSPETLVCKEEVPCEAYFATLSA
jgi:hypothetical protein